MRCPICRHNGGEDLIKLNCGNFDRSPLYRSANIVLCQSCGHIYNKLNKADISGLSDYYNYEYSPNNLSSTNFGGDRPGSADLASLKRYRNLYALIKPYLQSHMKILDGGCATGGFLDFLNGVGMNNLYGIDFSKKYIKVAIKNNHKVKFGNVEKIPFGDKYFNLVVMDQVLEHLVNPKRAFVEAKRVLSTNGGLLCISVPDASRYKEKRFFDFYWFLLREHIQHFDIWHLKLLGLLNGFEMIDYSKTESPMMSNKMILPALNVVFRLKSVSNIKKNTNDEGKFKLHTKIESYINQEFKSTESKIKTIKQLSVENKPLYVYGMSREFLYLYELGLKKCNIASLIDDTPFKQKKLKVDGRKIYGSSVLSKAPKNSVILITAFAHTPKMKENLKRIDYQGKIISL